MLIRNPSQVELDCLTYRSIISPDPHVTQGSFCYEGQNLYLRGPILSLGSDIIRNGDDSGNAYFYVDLTMDKKKAKHQEFYTLVKNVDYFSIAEIAEHPEKWYHGSTEISLIQIEQEYIPTIKLSTMFSDRHSLKLKIPCDHIEFFDQDNMLVPYQLIKENYTVRPLLHLVATHKDNSHIWTQWDLPQLKVTLPETILKECQLIDVSDTDEEEAIPEVVPCS